MTTEHPVSKTDEHREAAFQAAVWQTIEAKAKQKKDEARARLGDVPVGETVAGRWDGQIIAKATMAKGKKRLVVTDDRALLAWVKEHHPTEVVEAVNPAYIKTIEAKAISEGLGAVIDSQGVVIPGVEVQTSDPTVSVRREPGAEEIIAELFAAGRVSMDGINVKAIESDTVEVVDGEVVE